MKLLTTLSLIIFFISCSENKLNRLDFLVGTWKNSEKGLYEVWEMDENNTLKGYSYTLKNNEKVISEFLRIYKLENSTVYEAKVIHQNEGKAILFALNEKIKSTLSFENNNHDFPKKIQYKRIDINKIEVKVLGDNEQGFSYFYVRQ
ncbi:MAG: DUF6265 family protein [Bacteroidota bacterium]